MKRITKMKTNDCYPTKNKKQEGQTIDLCLSNRKDFSSVSVDTRKGNFPISFTKLNKMKIFARIFLILLFVFALHITLHTLNSYAAVPHLINYQGRLTDTAGVPLNGTYTITFRIYDAETAGSLFWQGTYSVSIQKGIFAVLLGDMNDAGYNFSSLAFDKPYFLEIKVGAEVMSPRQRIASVGYAIKAENVDALPRGIIAMWSGKITDIPSGWVLCDGTNGTPDLRDRFIVGARQDLGGTAKTNLTGSLTQSGGTPTLSGVSGSHVLTTSEIPAHSHSLSNYYMATKGATRGWADYEPGGWTTTFSTGETPYTDSVGGGVGHTHSTEISPYYALAFIMKT